MKTKQFTAWIIIACLLLAGCQSAGNSQLSEVSPTDLPNQPLNNQEPLGDGHIVANGILAFQAGGRVRIPYGENADQVLYITSPDQLPDQEALKQYDEAFFKDHALVLVYQTTTSGSIQLEIDGIAVEDGVAKVSLKQRMDGDVGTADMATWMLWAEVDAGLDLKWKLDSHFGSNTSLDMHTH